MAENIKPPLTITVLVGDAPKEIKMTYGLEMDLRRVLPDPSSAMQLTMVDQETQDYVIRRCLTDTKKMIHDPNELIAVEDVELDSESMDDLLLWALEHQLYFFAKRAKGVMTLAARQQTKAPQLPSTDGSETSTTTTPSAGPSDASKETSPTSSGDTPGES